MSPRAARPCLGDGLLWQRTFLDHVIRDEGDCGEVRAYMDGTPSRWAEDELYADGSVPNFFQHTSVEGGQTTDVGQEPNNTGR